MNRLLLSVPPTQYVLSSNYIYILLTNIQIQRLCRQVKCSNWNLSCLKMSHLNIEFINDIKIALRQMNESLNEHVKVLDEAIKLLDEKQGQDKLRELLIQLRKNMQDEAEDIVKRPELR